MARSYRLWAARCTTADFRRFEKPILVVVLLTCILARFSLANKFGLAFIILLGLYPLSAAQYLHSCRLSVIEHLLASFNGQRLRPDHVYTATTSPAISGLLIGTLLSLAAKYEPPFAARNRLHSCNSKTANTQP